MGGHSPNVTMRPLPPLSHSLSVPSFSNTTYSYSYSPVFPAMTSNPTNATTITTGDDLQKLVTNGQQMAHNLLVNKSSNKVSNNDLIDLIDTESKDVLQLFDPLLLNVNDCQMSSDDNNLNFSNNFELDSDSSVNDETDKTEEVSNSVRLHPLVIFY